MDIFLEELFLCRLMFCFLTLKGESSGWEGVMRLLMRMLERGGW